MQLVQVQENASNSKNRPWKDQIIMASTNPQFPAVIEVLSRIYLPLEKS